MLTICDEPSKGFYAYRPLLEELQNIKIDRAEKNMSQEMVMMGDVFGHFREVKWYLWIFAEEIEL